MKCFVLLTVLIFASKNENNVESGAANLEEEIMQNAENPILVKIEEDEYVKVKKRSKFIGVFYHEKTRKWCATRRSKSEKQVYNGYYKDEEIAAHASDTLARKLMANCTWNYRLNFPDDDTKVSARTRKTKFIGMSYNKIQLKWQVRRWSRNENRYVYYGYNANEETAAHASDTLARILMAKAEEGHKMNFPDDDTDVHKEVHKIKTANSDYIGLYYNEKTGSWLATRWNKTEKKAVNNGYYKDKETAAHASDTLARKLMANGEHHSLNFPDDYTEVNKENVLNLKEKKSRYIGVYYNEKIKIWSAQRWSKREKKLWSNGTNRNEEKAAHASDTLARQLMANGDLNLKLNFPDDETEENPQHQINKRKRPFDFEYSQSNEDNFEKFEE